MSGHKQMGDHVIMRQKPLQNDFLTQHLYSAQNIRYVNTGSSKILDSILSSRSSRLQKKSRLAISSISTQETTSKNRIRCGLGGVFVFRFVRVFERRKAFNFHTHINHFAHLSSTTVSPFKTMSNRGW